MEANYRSIPKVNTDLPESRQSDSSEPILVLRQTVSQIKIETNIAPTVHTFINIIGAPPLPSDQRETVNQSILCSPSPNETMDVLDASDEDPFTLETFQSMIQMHAAKNLDFIIARVKTQDLLDTRYYYSYYAAHHINKVLFRTQPEEGLLHRMRAKNPLNNMTIIGDVHYYIIKPAHTVLKSHSASPKSPFKVLVDLILPDEDENSEVRRAKDVRDHLLSNCDDSSILTRFLHYTTQPSFSKGPLQFVINPDAYEADIELKEIRRKRNSFDEAFTDNIPSLRPTSDFKLEDISDRHRNLRSAAFANERTISMTIEDWIRLKSNPSPEAIVMSASTRITIDPPRKRHVRSPVIQNPSSISISAKYYASDDDFLMHSSVRSYFKSNALDQDHGYLSH